MAQLNISPFVEAPVIVARRPARARRTLLSAANVVARRLSALPPSADVQKLRASVAAYMQDVEQDNVIPANDHLPDALTLRILALHTEVARIESREREGA